MPGVGVPPGLAGASLGEVGEARTNFNRMVKCMTRLKEISENVAGDRSNLKKYVKELSDVCTDMFRTTGSVFEQECLRFINMVTAVGSGGAGGGSSKYPRGIMENNVINSLRAVNGDKSQSKQWHQKFTTALRRASCRCI